MSLDEPADFSALANESQVAHSEDHIRDALAKGAGLETGGQRLMTGEFARGHYFQPTLLSGCNHDMLVMQQETFGPVLAVSTFRDIDELIHLANDTVYGLSRRSCI